MPRDTTPEAQCVQTQAQRSLGGPRRLKLACAMSRTVRELMCARIRMRHPELDERGITDRVLWELYGFRRDS